MHCIRDVLSLRSRYEMNGKEVTYCLSVDRRDFREEGITFRAVFNDSQIKLLALGKIDGLLIDLTTPNHKNTLNLRLHLLALCEDQRFINRTANIYVIRKLQLSSCKERVVNPYWRSSLSLEIIMFTRSLRGRNRSGND